MMTPAITNAARSWSMPPPMPATAPSTQIASFTDLRLHALHECRKVGVCLRPERMDVRADDGPSFHTRAWSRNLHGVGLDALHEFLRRVAQRTHQQARRHHEERHTNENDQRGRQSLPPAHRCTRPAGGAGTS
mgnify:CR=1 FL=1